MSLNPWNKRVHCIHSWAVYSFSVEVLSELLGKEVREISVLDGTPMRIANLKAIKTEKNIDDGSIYLINNSTPSCALCDPGLFGADIVIENMKLNDIDQPIWCEGIPKDSNITKEQIDLLDKHFAPHQLDLSDYELEGALRDLEAQIKQQSDLARVTYEFLSCHPAIGFVSYVGATTHQDYSLTNTILRGGFTGYIDFMLKDTRPKTVLNFLDSVSSTGIDVEFLSVDEERLEIPTVIRMKCSAQSTLEHLQILEHALSSCR